VSFLLRGIPKVKVPGNEVRGSPNIAEPRATVVNMVEVSCVLWFWNVVPKGMLVLSVPRMNWQSVLCQCEERGSSPGDQFSTVWAQTETFNSIFVSSIEKILQQVTVMDVQVNVQEIFRRSTNGKFPGMDHLA